MESEPGKGSVFHFTTRFGAPANEPVASSADRAGLGGLRALVVGDPESIGHRVLEPLADWGLRVTVAETTADAVAQLEALGTVKHVLRLGPMHGRDDVFYVERYKPTFWSGGIFIVVPFYGKQQW